MTQQDTGTEEQGDLALRLDKQMDESSDASGRPKSRVAAKLGAVSPSPNPMTNLLIADVVLRGGSRIMRQLVETNLLKTKYPPQLARDIIRGRGVVRTLAGAAIARLATRSVPGALFVGGGLLAKALYDRSKGDKAKAKGEEAVSRRAAKANSEKKPVRRRAAQSK
jgi:hypothetical protein